VRYWHGYLSGASSNSFSHGPSDVKATTSSLAPVKSRMVYLSGAGLPRLSWKKAIKVNGCGSVSGSSSCSSVFRFWLILWAMSSVSCLFFDV